MPFSFSKSTRAELERKLELEPYLARDGSRAMLGELTLAGEPSEPLHAVTKAYVDGLAARELRLVGAYNAAEGSARYLQGSGYSGRTLLSASEVDSGQYVIVEVGGRVPVGPVIGQNFKKGDWILSDGISWTRLALGGPSSLASGLLIDPPVHGQGNVQAALARTLSARGGQVEGPLVFVFDNQGITFFDGAGVYKKAGAGLVLRCPAGNLQPQIEGFDGQNARPILDPQNLWRAGLVNGQSPLPIVDLNTVQPPGYRCGVYGLADGPGYLNLPPEVPTTGAEANRWLCLFSHNADTSADVIQILYDVCRPAPRIWSRYKVDGAFNWSAWAGLYDELSARITALETKLAELTR